MTALLMAAAALSARATTLYYGIGLNGILQINRTTGAGTLIYSSSPFPAASNAAALAIEQTSGGGGAAAGCDRNVKAIRWRVTAGSLSQTAPNNTGSVSFIVLLR